MGTSLAEVILIAAVIYGLYRLLKPLQQWLEGAMLRILNPNRPKIIDVKPTSGKTKR